MDKSKQPGISFDGVILVREDFFRDYEVDEDAKINLKFKAINNIQEESATVELETELELTSDNKTALRLNCNFVGFFSIDKDNENMEMEDYIKNNAPALIFPYIREHISSVTTKAGIRPVLLPPINIISLIESEEI